MQTRILDKGVPGEGGGGFTVFTGGGQGDIETTFGWGYTPSVCYGMRKICIIAQFSLEILLIQYW